MLFLPPSVCPRPLGLSESCEGQWEVHGPEAQASNLYPATTKLCDPGQVMFPLGSHLVFLLVCNQTVKARTGEILRLRLTEVSDSWVLLPGFGSDLTGICPLCLSRFPA